MRDEVVFIGSAFDRMLALSVALQGKNCDVTVIRARKTALGEAMACGLHPTAMLVTLDGTETVTEVRELMSALPETRILCVTPARPPSAALARIVRAHGGAILSADDADVVVVATLIAMSAKPALVDAR
jgi:hypothetical protein